MDNGVDQLDRSRVLDDDEEEDDKDVVYLTREQLLRIKALELSSELGGPPDKVVARAEAYAAFLHGGA